MIFPKEFPDKLRSSILTSEVIGKKVKLKQRGNEFQGLCPFHNEKSPSFTVNDQKGFYHCFGCQAHGDIISFVMNNEGLDYKEAVINLADNFGIPIPQIKQENQKEYDRLERDYLILEKICQFFEDNLYGNSGFAARKYLKTRNLNSNLSKKFRLGFASNSYDELNIFLKKQNFSEAEILRSGVVGKNDRGQIYDKFRNRVIFPITDKKNRVIAFGGRTIGDDLPKYLNSSETEIFKKNQTLYNIFLARKAIFKESYAIVVEGYMDAISLYSNGIENVVAGLGTAFGIEHLKELFYITDKVVICLDGDNAGIKAAKRVSEIALPLINSKKNIAFTILPNQMDPDDFIKEFGSEEAKKSFKNAIPLSEGLFEFSLMELGIKKNDKISAEQKAKIENNLLKKLELISDSSLKKYFSLYFKDLLFNFGRKNNKLAQNLDNFNRNIYKKPKNNSLDILAKNIIAFILKYPNLASFKDDIFDINELHFYNNNLSQIKDILIEEIGNNEKNPLSTLENSEFSNDIADIKNITTKFEIDDENIILTKFRILLFKDLLIKVDQQYKDSLDNIEEVEKIKEIFDYKNHLEQEILSLEKELI